MNENQNDLSEIREELESLRVRLQSAEEESIIAKSSAAAANIALADALAVSMRTPGVSQTSPQSVKSVSTAPDSVCPIHFCLSEANSA